MRIAIIGGTRLIGPYVVRQLFQQGHAVTVYHRGRHEAELPDGVRHIRAAEAGIPVTVFPKELLESPFDVVIHMIPMGEADAHAAMQTFRGRARRLIAIGSGDVYRAYGRFMGSEPGPLEEGLLTEDSPLRAVLYPYRHKAKSPDELSYYYEKILVEREVMSDPLLPGTVLRLPKVYGPGENAGLATVYGYRRHPQWRWTHGYVENVAAAIALAALDPAATGRIYNVGEKDTPTVAERLAELPVSSIPLAAENGSNPAQNMAYDTSRIRNELGYTEPVEYQEGLRRTFRGRNEGGAWQ